MLPSARRTNVATPPASGNLDASTANAPASGTDTMSTAMIARIDAGPAAAALRAGRVRMPVPSTDATYSAEPCQSPTVPMCTARVGSGT